MQRARKASILMVMIVAFLLLVGWQDWKLYYRTMLDDAHPQARIGRFLYRLPTEVAACGFVDPYELWVRETYFLAWPRQVVDLPPDVPDAMLGTCPGLPFVWVLSYNHVDRLDALRARWPGGIVEEHREPDGDLVFTSYLVLEGHESHTKTQRRKENAEPRSLQKNEVLA